MPNHQNSTGTTCPTTYLSAPPSRQIKLYLEEKGVVECKCSEDVTRKWFSTNMNEVPVKLYTEILLPNFKDILQRLPHGWAFIENNTHYQQLEYFNAHVYFTDDRHEIY